MSPRSLIMPTKKMEVPNIKPFGEGVITGAGNWTGTGALKLGLNKRTIKHQVSSIK